MVSYYGTATAEGQLAFHSVAMQCNGSECIVVFCLYLAGLFECVEHLARETRGEVECPDIQFPTG